MAVACDDSAPQRGATEHAIVAGDPTLPVEAKLLIVSGTSSEPELAAMRTILDYRGVPYDVFVASVEPPLDASRLRAGERGMYQGTILTTSSLGGQLSASEWTALADFEQHFAVRRAVLSATPDSALGWGSATTQNTSTTPLTVRCTSAGTAIFRDVNCGAAQTLRGDTAYLSSPVTGALLTPLLTDSAGHALAAIHMGGDGREQLLLLFRQNIDHLHSHQFLHGVLDWVAGGTWIGERRIDMSAQIDDLLLGTVTYTDGAYKLTAADMRAALAWADRRRATSITPNFHVAWAFNGYTARDGDSLTEEIRAQRDQWWWINHTFDHHLLDDADYDTAYFEFTANTQVALDLPLVGYDVRNYVPPNISGLVNPEVMRAAFDAGIRFAVTDTSKPGCDPKPNTAFYSALQPTILLIPRRPTNLFWDVSTPDEWVAAYNAQFRDHWGRDSTYAQILDQESEDLLEHLMRGDADPWMFHRAEMRAYDGVHSLLGDLIDATLAKLGARLTVPVRTPPMEEIAARFERRVNLEGAGVRATLYRGRALVIDAGRTVTLPVTGVRAEDGEAYGGDVIQLVTVTPGTSTCIPLDSAGLGCSPSPGRVSDVGAVTNPPRGTCDGTGNGLLPPNSEVAIARKSTWRFWDQGGSLGTGWRARTYSDSSWRSGAGPLGYGETYLGTTLSYGPSSSNKYTTTYFRRTFIVDNPGAVIGIRGELMYDDGAVIYLNGTEIARAAMPAGTISASTFSTGHEASNSYTILDLDAAKSLLVAGSNTLAVELHQADLSSSDLVFDVGLVLERSSPPPPPPPPPPMYDGGIPIHATWWYWDNGGDLGTAWRTTAGGPSWESAGGPMGFGETYLRSTWPTNTFVTHYFTTQFQVADASQVAAMLGQVMYDDGFVAYLNGVEIGRAAMPTGAIASTTQSSGHEANNTYASFDWTAGLAALRDGTNTLAVEVHQAGTASSDLVFDLGLSLGLAPPPPPPPGNGVEKRSRWWYWDRGGDLGTAWRTSQGGTNWRSGVGVLGFGESYIATPMATGYITAYFTTAFDLHDASAIAKMTGEVMYDDGFVVYVNGVEIGRAGMPTGTVTASTLSSGHEANNVYQTFDWSAFTGALRDGTNVVAVEVHQQAASSSDLVFDLALRLEAQAAATDGIARGETWSYWDGDDAPTADASWASRSYDEELWPTGAGPLGYGESFLATTISYGPDPNDKPMTAYFRHWFDVDDPSASTRMIAELLFDDGVVVYLNGMEIARLAMPTGAINHDTASSGHETGVYESFDWSAYRHLLVPGKNVIAVEVHQQSRTSSDLTFDLSLQITP